MCKHVGIAHLIVNLLNSINLHLDFFAAFSKYLSLNLRSFMEYLLPVSKRDIEIANITIQSILRNNTNSKIIVLTKTENTNLFINPNTTILDEDKIIDGLSFDSIRVYLKSLFDSTERTGWYFQQFLKMAYSLISEGDYIIWDSDTFMLKNISFVVNNQQILYYKNVIEHESYKRTFNSLLPDVTFIKDRSFVNEIMYVDKSVMIDIISSIESRFSKPFYQAILDNICSSDYFAGFSEYATYSNYVMHFRSNYRTVRAKHFREGTRIFGEVPILQDLKCISKQYNTISFEKWHKKIEVNSRLRKWLICFLGLKLFSFILFRFYGIFNTYHHKK